MSWSVVHFLNDDSVEAVPAIWIIKESKQCYWPSINGAKLKNLIAKCESPCDEWETFPIRIIGSSYDNLATARYKAIKAETTSDLNSDLEHEKRIRKKNTLLSSSGSDSDENMNGIKQMPILQQNASQNRKDVKSRTQPVMLKDHLVKVSVPAEVSSPKSPNHQVDEDNRSVSTQLTPSKSNLFHDENFKRQILRQLNILSIKIDQLSQDISNINLINSRQDEESVQQESILDQFQLPLRTEKDLNMLEDFLNKDENVSKVVKELSIIGGTNFKVMVKRLMQRVLHDELAVLYSWIGFKQKKNFSSLNLCSTLIDAVQKGQKNKCSNAEIENVMKLWLVKAKERLRKKD